MTKTIRTFNIMIMAIIAVTLAACGGGGGGGGTSQQSANTIITGVASKGLIKNGAIKVYAITSGTKGTLLATTTTDANGRYSANLGSYTGAVLIEVSGSYTDEATGETRVVDPASPLRAFIGNVSGTVNLSVTPFTEIAVSLAPTLTPAAIDTANALVSSIFKVDIVATSPVDAAKSAMSGATQAQKDYTLALAAVSQAAKDSNSTLHQTITTISSGITSTGASTQTMATITAALGTFLASSNNLTGVTTLVGSNLANLAKRDITLAFAIQGNIPASGSGGAQFTFTLPAGVSMQTADGELPATIIKASGVAVTGTNVSGKRSGSSITAALIASSPVTSGEILTMAFQAEPGTSVTAGMFTLSAVKVVDINGAALNAATVGVSVR